MSKKKENEGGLLSSLQHIISDKLLNMFDLVIKERKHYHEENANEKTPDDKKIIQYYGNTNAAVSGGLSLIPGIAGLLTALPELILVIRNQLQMIYDIGAAHKKEKLINKELLAGILVSYFGSKGIEMLTIQGSKVFLRETSIKMFGHVISLLSIEISEQLIQSAIVKWVPIAGSVAMAVWSRYTTMRIGKYATNIFSKNIEQSKEIAKERAVASISESELKMALERNKIKALINLMGIDMSNDQRELKFIELIIQNSSLDLDEQLDLAKKLHEKVELAVDLKIIKENPTATIGLVIDMISLAKMDENTQLAEMLYLKKISGEIGLSKEDLEELMKP